MIETQELDLAVASFGKGRAAGRRLWSGCLVWTFSEGTAPPNEMPLAFFPDPARIAKRPFARCQAAKNVASSRRVPVWREFGLPRWPDSLLGPYRCQRSDQASESSARKTKCRDFRRSNMFLGRESRAPRPCQRPEASFRRWPTAGGRPRVPEDLAQGHVAPVLDNGVGIRWRHRRRSSLGLPRFLDAIESVQGVADSACHRLG